MLNSGQYKLHDALVEGDWIYYINSNDGNRIYKANLIGNYRTKIADDSVSDIELYGSYVYYRKNYSYYKDKNSYNLFKIDTEGCHRTSLGKCVDEGFKIVDGWIYFTCTQQYNQTNLYRMQTDGSNETLLSGNIIRKFLVRGDWIYYIDDSYYDDSSYRRLYKMRTNGSDKTKLTNDLVWSFASSSDPIILADDWIYFSNASTNSWTYDDEYVTDISWGNLFKIKVDGSEQTRITEDNACSVRVVDGWIYYINTYMSTYEDDFSGRTKHRLTPDSLCRIRCDGNSKSILFDGEISYFTIYKGWIYFLNNSDRIGDEFSDYHVNTINKISVDGRGKMQITNDDATRLDIVDCWIYYRFKYENNKLYKVKVDGSGRTRIE